MNEFRADIHCHSHCSDGSDSPEELLYKAKSVGLQGLSITDHDTLEAYTPELWALAKELGIELLSGVEISSEQEQSSVHILGYNIQVDSEEIKTFLKNIILQREERNRAILAKLKKKGFFIEEEELIQFAKKENISRTIGRPHIALLMVAKQYVSTPQDAFTLYLREGASCFVSGFRITPKDACEAIHKAGGKAILAHPHFLKKGAFLRHLLKLPFDGIECYYGLLQKAVEKPWLTLAYERGWIATGGSDYHGALKPHIPLGCSWINQETFDKLRA